MAKKSRTPAPPRRSQAPQQRKDPRRQRSLPGGPWAALLALAAVAAVAARSSRSWSSRRAQRQRRHGGRSCAADEPRRSLQTGPAPWNPGLDTLPDRLDAVGVHALSTEARVLHIHQHLDIFVNGKPMPVPAEHRHLRRPVPHRAAHARRERDHAPRVAYGTALHARRVLRGLGRAAERGLRRRLLPSGDAVVVCVNGQPYTGDPARLELDSHQEIAFVIGTPPKQIPRSQLASRLNTWSFRALATILPPRQGWRDWSYAPDLKSRRPPAGTWRFESLPRHSLLGRLATRTRPVPSGRRSPGARAPVALRSLRAANALPARSLPRNDHRTPERRAAFRRSASRIRTRVATPAAARELPAAAEHLRRRRRSRCRRG